MVNDCSQCGRFLAKFGRIGCVVLLSLLKRESLIIGTLDGLL